MGAMSTASSERMRLLAGLCFLATVALAVGMILRPGLVIFLGIVAIGSAGRFLQRRAALRP